MTVEEIDDIVNKVTLLTAEITDAGKVSQMSDDERVALANLVRASDAFSKVCKSEVRSYIAGGGSITGVNLGNSSVSHTVDNWAGIKAYMVTTYKMDPDYLDKSATITMSNLYRLDIEGSKTPGKKESEIRELYTDYLATSIKQGALKF